MTAAVARESGSSTARRMFMLRFGAEPSPKSVSVRGARNSLIWCPVVGIAVETDAGWVFLETGIGRAFLEDEASRRRIYASREQPWGVGDDPFLDALGSVGLRPDNIALAAAAGLTAFRLGGGAVDAAIATSWPSRRPAPTARCRFSCR